MREGVPTTEELSYAAYLSIVDKLPEVRAKIYQYIRSQGRYGATSEEICDGLGWENGGTHGRTTELARLGLIEAVGARPNRSGRQATVWAAIEPRREPEQASLF